MLETLTIRRRYLFAIDLALLATSFVIAVALRFETLPTLFEPLGRQLPLLWLSLTVRPACYLLFGLYRRVWRYATVVDFARVVLAGVVASSIILALNFAVFPSLGIGAANSYSVFLLDTLISLVAVLGIRVLRKLMIQMPEARSVRLEVGDDRQRVLIAGANAAGEMVVRQLIQDHGETTVPVGFVDANRVMHRMTIHGVPVLGGPEELDEILATGAVDIIVIAGESDPATTREVVRIGRRHGVATKTAGLVASDIADQAISRPEDPSHTGAVVETVGRAPAPPTVAADFDLAIIGLGYVGLPIAVAASKVGLRVLGVDVDETKVARLAGGESHIEDISTDEVEMALRAGFHPTTDTSLLAKADTISISVPTPLSNDMPDLSAVLAASRSVGTNLKRGHLVILESTTYPGTTEEVVLPILEEESGLIAGVDFDVAYSPERIDPGNNEWTVENTPKLIGGHTVEAGERAAAFYGKFCSEVVVLGGTREAEMAKLLENTYRHVNIALVNEMAVYCNELGVDIWEAIRGAATKPFGFQPFYPGPGVGGHCIPIDPGYLSYRVRQIGGEAKFVELAHEINHHMPTYVVERAAGLLAQRGLELRRAKVLVVGVAYKPNVSDTRETPATGVIRALRAGGAAVVFADPLVSSFEVDDEPVARADDILVTAAEADLVILHTPHAEIDLGELVDRAPAILDTRGILSGPNVSRL